MKLPVNPARNKGIHQFVAAPEGVFVLVVTDDSFERKITAFMRKGPAGTDTKVVGQRGRERAFAMTCPTFPAYLHRAVPLKRLLSISNRACLGLDDVCDFSCCRHR